MNNTSLSKKVALSGILLSLTLICLFLAATLPVNELSLYILSSFLVSIIVIEFGVKAGWMFYLASCLLTLVIPNKIEVVPYIVFFGVYGIIKYYIEKLNRITLEFALKLVFFNLFVAVAIFLVIELIPGNLKSLPWWLLIIGVQVVFLIYDYAYTLFIQYYRQKLRGILKI